MRIWLLERLYSFVSAIKRDVAAVYIWFQHREDDLYDVIGELKWDQQEKNDVEFPELLWRISTADSGVHGHRVLDDKEGRWNMIKLLRLWSYRIVGKSAAIAALLDEELDCRITWGVYVLLSDLATLLDPNPIVKHEEGCGDEDRSLTAS